MYWDTSNKRENMRKVSSIILPHLFVLRLRVWEKSCLCYPGCILEHSGDLLCSLLLK